MQKPIHKLRTNKSRQDYQLYHILFPKFDPDIIQHITITVSPSQIIRPQHQVATYALRTPTNTQQHTIKQQFPLLINTMGIVDSISEDFEEIHLNDKLVYRLKQGQKKGNMELFTLKDCDHRPKKQMVTGCEVKSQYTNVKASRVNICQRCQQVLWKYYDEEEVEISLQNICSMNSIHNVESMMNNFSWSIIKNQQFTKTTQIGKLQDQEVNVPYLAKATFLINFEQYRQKINEKTIIMKLRKVICKHQKIIQGRCQFCFEEVVVEQSANRGYFYQDQSVRGTMKMSDNALKQHEQQYIQNLLNAKKAIIILDLDNTILHSNEISQLELPTINKLKEFYIIPKLECAGEEEGGKKDLIVVKMRPFFKHFIFVIAKFFQIYVYTKGTRPYAQQICKYIRAQYAGEQCSHHYITWKPQRLLFLKNEKAFTTNVITRNEDNSTDTKSLDMILPTKTEYHLILDDRRDVWNNSNSWFFTREYFYFFKRSRRPQESVTQQEDISQYLTNEDVELPQVRRRLIEQCKSIKAQLPQKQSVLVQTYQREDYYLLFAAYALRKVHKNFFEAIKTQKAERQYRSKNSEENQQKNNSSKASKISLSYQYAKIKYFLKNQRIRYFLGEDQTQMNSNTIRRGKKMGAITVTDDNPKLIIRANDLMKQTKKPSLVVIPPSQEPQINPNYYQEQKKKLGQLFNNKIPVVSQSWIHFCYEFNYPFNYQPFCLTDPYQLQVTHQSFFATIEYQARMIRKNIQDEIQKQINPQLRKRSRHSSRIEQQK